MEAQSITCKVKRPKTSPLSHQDPHPVTSSTRFSDDEDDKRQELEQDPIGGEQHDDSGDVTLYVTDEVKRDACPRDVVSWHVIL